jgi:hypothetical protein
MKAVESNFLKFIQGPKQFVIPIYQRTYSWTVKPQCEELWNDIVYSATHDKVQGHFIGSIVYIQGGIYQSSAISELLVIDGQQRLATLSCKKYFIIGGHSRTERLGEVLHTNNHMKILPPITGIIWPKSKHHDIINLHSSCKSAIQK